MSQILEYKNTPNEKDIFGKIKRFFCVPVRELARKISFKCSTKTEIEHWISVYQNQTEKVKKFDYVEENKDVFLSANEELNSLRIDNEELRKELKYMIQEANQLDEQLAKILLFHANKNPHLKAYLDELCGYYNIARPLQKK